MSYWLDIKGQANVIIHSEKTPRVGEVVVLGPLTFPEQEDEIEFNVINVIYRLDGQRLKKEMPVVVLKPIPFVE